MSRQNQTLQRNVGRSYRWHILAVIIAVIFCYVLLLFHLNSVSIERFYDRQSFVAHGLSGRLDLHIASVDGISQRIARNSHIISRLVENPNVSDNEELNRDLQHILEAIMIAVDADIVYVMNDKGMTIASTTYNGNQSLTGHAYPFRPYFLSAMQGNNMIFPALGVTTNVRGIYFSSPVLASGRERPAGVIVIKMGLAEVDKLFEEFPHTAGLMSPDGIIFACNKKEWHYKAAMPIPAERLDILKQTRQFGHQPLTPLPVYLEKERLDIDGQSYALTTQTGAISGWKVFTLTPLKGTFPLTMAIVVFILITLILLLIILNLTGNRKKSLLARDTRLAREEIEAQNKFLRTVMDSLAHPFYIIDINDYSVIMANKAAGFDPKRDGPNPCCHFLTHKSEKPCGMEDQDHLCPVEIIRKTKKPLILEHIHKVKGGKNRYHEIHAYPIFDKDGNLIQMVEYNLDITNRKRMENELMKSRQLESIGILAGGIAHDFNNMLSVIIGNIELVKDDIPPDNPNYKFLDHAENNALKAADLSRKLITFSKGGWLEKKKLFLPVLIKQVAEDMEPDFRFDFSMEFPDNLKAIHGDERQLSQVFVNILRNASEASDEETLPAIYIEANNVDTNDEVLIHKLQTAGITDFTAGFVKVAITDKGKGIPVDSLTKIFDPYYTTKQASDRKGTGLGLTLCYSIVKKHGGLITVNSEPGKYTTIEIYLPAFTGSTKLQNKT